VGGGGGVSQAETPEEQVLAECLREIFNTGQLNFEHNFSEAGGDSLGAIQLITLLIEKKFTIEIVDIINPEHTLRDIARLLVPHVASIVKKPAGVWEKPDEWSEEQFNRVITQYGRENIERIYDLSREQNAILSFCLANPERETFHIQNSYTVQGPLDLDLCCTAFGIAARKHLVLQTAVAYRDVPVPKQIIVSNRGLEIAVIVGEPLEAVLDREFRRGFDFEKDNLLRIVLLKEGTRYTHIIVSGQHVILDGWSLEVLMQDFTETYRKLANGTPLTVLEAEAEQERKSAFSYEDFVNYIKGLDHEGAVSYFVKKLAGYTTKADLIHDYPNPQGNWGCSREFLDIPQNIVEGIRTAAQQCRVSPAAIYEGVYAFLLQKACGSTDVVFSTLSNGRVHPIKNLVSLFGFFLNRMQARVKVGADTSFVELFTQVQKQMSDDLKYDFVALSEVEKRLGYPSISASCFNYYQMTTYFTLTDDVSVSFDMEYQTSFDNILVTVEAGESTRIQIMYNNCNFTQDTIRQFLNSYLPVLEYAITHVNAKLSEVSIGSFNSVLEKQAIAV
jgi:acyl carrier protein